MTDNTLKPVVVLSPPSSPKSPRGITQEDSIAIRGTIKCFRKGELHIDEVVSKLLPEALKRRPYAREVYNRLVEEVRAVPELGALVGSRKALYAASIFSRYAGCADEFEAVDSAFIAQERVLKISNPELYVGKL